MGSEKKDAPTVNVYQVSDALETSSSVDINSTKNSAIDKTAAAPSRPLWKKKTFIIAGITMISLLVAGAVALAVTVHGRPAQSSNCEPVHIFVTRGSSEPAGEGLSRKLADSVKAVIPGAVSSAIDYPAKWPYTGSMSVGSANLKRDIAQITHRCPKTKLVLIGYSQGGAATMDAVCGGGNHPEIGPHTPGLTKEEGKNVKAVTVFGEPRFVSGLPYTAGSDKTRSGRYERDRKDAECTNFSSTIRSYCDMGDNRCASDGNDWFVHGQYFNRYLEDATSFIVEKLK